MRTERPDIEAPLISLVCNLIRMTSPALTLGRPHDCHFRHRYHVSGKQWFVPDPGPCQNVSIREIVIAAGCKRSKIVDRGRENGPDPDALMGQLGRAEPVEESGSFKVPSRILRQYKISVLWRVIRIIEGNNLNIFAAVALEVVAHALRLARRQTRARRSTSRHRFRRFAGIEFRNLIGRKILGDSTGAAPECIEIQRIIGTPGVQL